MIFTIALIFLALVNSNRSYKSQEEIMIIFKSEKASQNSDQILGNLEVIVKSLSFYNRMLLDNPNLGNAKIMELPDYKKKKYWNEEVNIEKIRESSSFKITALGENQYAAETLNAQTVKSLIGVAGTFYDIQNDIDIRIIDKPITKLSFSGSYLYSFIESLILGFVLAFLLSYFVILSGKNKPKKQAETALSWTYKKEKAPEIMPEEKPWQISKTPKMSFGKKAAAPDNLPIAENEIFPISKVDEIIETESVVLTHEATKEEVKERIEKLSNKRISSEEAKERLNKLLAGKI